MTAWARQQLESRERVYVPPHPQGDLGGIDFDMVYRQAFPGWSISMSRGDPEPIENARLRLTALLAKDNNLSELFGEMHRLADEDAAANADALLDVVWSWNRYLSERGHPWRLSGAVIIDQEGKGRFYTKSYALVYDAQVRVGEAVSPTRLLLRVDGTNVVENYLGAASSKDDGAAVVLDRVGRFTRDEVWPLLDEAPERVGVARAFAPAVQAAARTHLEPAELAILATTASDRRQLLDLIAGIGERRSCGGGLVVHAVSTTGFDDDDLARLERYALADRGAACPSITPGEVSGLRQASERLRAAPGLAEAVEALGALVAGSVAVHESRHGASEPDEACEGCPDRGGLLYVSELHAYVAGFGHKDSHALAVLQACGQDLGLMGASGEALDVLFSELLPGGCEGGPPADLAARANDLEARWFGSADPIVLPADFPHRVPLEDRR